MIRRFGRGLKPCKSKKRCGCKKGKCGCEKGLLYGQSAANRMIIINANGGDPASSPFMVEYGDDRLSYVDGNTVLTDINLTGKSGYPVSSTQLNNSAFRPVEIEYRPSQGSFAILDFELNAGEIIIVHPNW